MSNGRLPESTLGGVDSSPEAIARDMAKRCGWSLKDPGFRHVHEDDLTKAIVVVIKAERESASRQLAEARAALTAIAGGDGDAAEIARQTLARAILSGEPTK